MAAFLPHYAVHYADAEHSLEEVTKGYRLALVYSLCLPPLSMRHLKRGNDNLLSEELAETLSTMGPEEESFALLLLHEYTEKSIEDLGSGALKGIDRARFVALEEANAAVPADRKMQFFIARLKHEIKYYGENGYEMSWWEESSRNHTITWFSTSGRRFGAENSTMKMNFLNSGHETFYELWRPHGSSKEKGFMGNHGPSKKTMYSRYAVIGWPAARGVKNALEFINEAAVSEMKTQKPIDTGAVGDILIKLQAELEKKKPNAKPISTEFFQALCEILVDAGDVAFVNEFFLKCFGKLCAHLQDKDAVVPVLTTMFRSLNWNEIGREVLESFGQLDHRTSLEIGVLVADGLDDGETKTALMHYGMEKAVQLSDGMASCSTKTAEILWKWVLGSDEPDALTTFAEKVTKSQPSSLDVATRVFVQCLDQIDTKGTKFAALAAIVEKRITWLKAQIQQLDKPFSWEMPDAEFSDNAQVQTFLRGTAQSMVTKDVHRFKKLQDAHNFVAKWMRAEQKSASYVMAASEEDGTAVVTITKTRAWFSARQKELLQYTTELEMLTTHFGEGAGASGDMELESAS
ncbi:hypothetical protein PF008_g28587 [Phytophthora fragariae]|uniref:Uncharacterized protein n=1 Tax=Phytophthora fragariae TaxID=53985 RepID=A0A6G0QB11_9STRA|nr:hypothetical protein PF008_g28587 [Phytophthora fragariae]